MTLFYAVITDIQNHCRRLSFSLPCGDDTTFSTRNTMQRKQSCFVTLFRHERAKRQTSKALNK